MGKIFSKGQAVDASQTSSRKSKINLDEHPILKTLTSQRRVDAMLKLADLKAPLLQAVFQRKIEAVFDELQSIKNTGNQKNFEHDLTLAFWFAIHIEDLRLAQALIETEFLLKQLVACALINKKGEDNDSDDEDEDADDWNVNGSGRGSNESFESENLSEEDKQQDKQDDDDQSRLQHEGGQSEDEDKRDKSNGDDDDDEDDDNVFSSDEDTQPKPQQKPQQNLQVNNTEERVMHQQATSATKELAKQLGELRRMKAEAEERKKREEEQKNAQALEMIGITEDVIRNTQLRDITELLKVKTSFRGKFQNLMTNVLKIALQKDEEKLACIITAYYEVALEEEMILRALTNESYEWLQFTWAFEKNYIGQKNKKDSHFITYTQLFDLIQKNYYGHEFQKEKINEQIKYVLEWKIISVDNILSALLIHHFDELAIEYMGYYSHFLDKELFIHCMTHGNTYFLQKALLLAAFDKMIFREDAVITQILDILGQGYRTNFLLNILTLIDISVWKNKHLKELVEIINDYVEENYDKNRLLLSPNPLMSIALAAEILNKIASSRRKFENECNKIQNQLLELGKMYSSKIENEKYYESLIMGVDFKGRTVLKTITQNTFEPLMDEEDPKAENLMVMIWHGKEATKCDGNIFGYSNLSHIIMTRAKKISGRNQSLIQMITNYYTPNFKVDYSFQYRYRSKAISFYFYKEFICALAMLIIFQYINYQYLILFSNNYIKTDDDTEQTSINKIIRSVRDYVNWNFFAIFFSAALLFQLLLKIMFNICSRSKIGIDKWTIMDSLSAILNIAAVQVVQKVPSDTYLKPKMKDLIDYFMIIVLCICWLRFFVYFLVVRSISKLLLTLIAMIGDTISFMFIVCCFILIMASVFTTLYQDTNPDKYGGLALTVRTLFDAAIGQYDYDNMEGRELSHSILLIAHVFFANILLMNYLIAILSTTYENMKQSGIFKYKVNLYQYCERFMIAFAEDSYGEIVLHPPPLSYLSALMIPFMVSRKAMFYISKSFSYLMYWIENVLLIFAFIGFEIAIFPVAYGKVWINLIKNSMGVLNTIVNCLIWLLIGFFVMFYLLLRDVAYLMKILGHHDGCKSGKVDELAEDPIDPRVKIQIYNETRATVISLYQRLQKHMRQEEIDENDEDISDEFDFFRIQDDENMNEDFLYVVKKSLIIDEWKKRRTQIEKKNRITAKSQRGGINALGSLMAMSFKKQLQQNSSNANMKTNKTNMSTDKNAMWGNNDPRSSTNQTKMANALKPKDLTNQLKVVFLDKLKKNASSNQEEENVDMTDFEISDKEVAAVDDFLTKFTIVSESSMNEHLDIMLMLKALPNKIMESSLDQTDMFNFRIFQESLIAYQNLDIVNAFEYFDDKNRERVQNVKDKLMNQRTNLNDVKDILELVKLKIERNEQYFQQQKANNGGNIAVSPNNAANVNKQKN